MNSIRRSFKIFRLPIFVFLFMIFLIILFLFWLVHLLGYAFQDIIEILEINFSLYWRVFFKILGYFSLAQIKIGFDLPVRIFLILVILFLFILIQQIFHNFYLVDLFFSLLFQFLRVLICLIRVFFLMN